MAKILSIETSSKICSVALHENGILSALQNEKNPNSHAEWLTTLINKVLEKSNTKINELSAVAVSSGPGSYTGLRIGVSTAKGICYALDIPLISINTLQGLAMLIPKQENGTLLCPMLDARRMEVYCAIFNEDAQFISATEAKIIDENSFSETLKNKKMFFFGDGAEKCKSIIRKQNAIFLDDIVPDASSFGTLAFQKFENKTFEDTAYFEPFYLKEFYTTAKL